MQTMEHREILISQYFISIYNNSVFYLDNIYNNGVKKSIKLILLKLIIQYKTISCLDTVINDNCIISRYHDMTLQPAVDALAEKK